MKHPAQFFLIDGNKLRQQIIKHYQHRVARNIDRYTQTELVVRNGRITPELSGTPTFREGKVVRLCAALEHRGLRPAETVFYTDSRNDLPLALASGDCVAVNPDPVLLEAARENGWLVNAWKL